ncbi:MAG: ATP-dependent Clp protease adapter ClpS [Magnetococcales bacterium]|nr:ATP-dependent Clp protease adapter ClpS [Magnetococcales bacterium]
MEPMEPRDGNESGILTSSRQKTAEPPMYKVILLNDDFTPMEFVVDLLIRFFNKSMQEATRIMLNVHHKGFGICGAYSREIAETKVTQVNQWARDHHHPLRCRMERN